MKWFWMSTLAVVGLAACSGGNPFTQTTENTDATATVPTTISSDLDSFTYDPVAQTLTVRGISLDNNPLEAVYSRRPALDRNGYEAYTTQAGPLDRHATGYVRDIDGTRAGIFVTGGQFGRYFGGGAQSRTGGFDRPDGNNATGSVSYAGNYIGLLNGAGDAGDLLPTAPGTPTAVLPTQAAEVTGAIFINADFTDNIVNGVIYNRQIVDSPATTIENLELAPSTIETDGTFTGDVSQNGQDRGDYAGIFGGTDAAVVAGTLFTEDHMANALDEEEFGVFVLAQCGTAQASAICNQPTP